MSDLISSPMKIQQFVSGSAVVLAGWLMATFFHEVSPQQYPQQRRGVPVHAANREAFKPVPQNGGMEARPGLVATWVK